MIFRIAAFVFAAGALAAPHAARADAVRAATPSWSVTEQKKPAPEKPPRPRPAPGPRDGGEDE